MNRSNLRLLVALIVAPLMPGLLLGVVALISGAPEEGLWAIRGAALVGYPIALLTGLPAYLWMGRRGWVGFPAYLGLALLYAIALSAWLFVRPALQRPEALNVTALALQSVVVLVGCVATLATFWLIARPDKRPGLRR